CVAAGDALEFEVGEHARVADDSAFRAAEGDVDDRALPGHPGGEGADFVEGNVWRETDAAFAGASGDGVLDSVAGEDFKAAVVKADGDVNGEFPGGHGADFSHAVVEVEKPGGFVEARFGGEPRVEFLFESGRSFEDHRFTFLLLCHRVWTT